MDYLKLLFGRFFRNKDNREVSSNVVYTLLIKGAAMLITVLIVPAYVRFFGGDETAEIAYGAWTTVAKVFTWITMFDFGIGNGLRNHLVRTLAAKDTESSKRYVSSAYVSVGVLSLLFAVVGSIVIAVIDWNATLKVAPDIVSGTVFRTYIQIVYLGVILHFFFLLISSICYAIQRTFLPSLFSLITNILLLLFIVIPNKADLETKLLQLSTVHMLAYNVPILLLTLFLFGKKLRDIRPSLKSFEWGAARQIMGLGGRFFLIQLALVALNNSDEFYITAFFNSAEVTHYTYYHKLFYIIMVVVALLAQPVWSAVTKAYYEKRYRWLQGLWRVMMGVAGLCSLGAILLALLYQPIANIWLGKGKVDVQPLTVILFALLTIESALNIASSFANGLGRLKCQTVCVVSGALLKVPLAYGVVQLFQKWDFVQDKWAAILLATVVAMLPLAIIQPLSIHRYIRKLVRSETTSE